MSHYSLAQKPAALSKWAREIVKSFEFNEIKDPVLVYRGMSGIACATALSLALQEKKINCSMIYVRKPEEISHGNPIEFYGEGCIANEYCSKELVSISGTLVFVDDFIVEGATKEACWEAIKSYTSNQFFEYGALHGSAWDRTNFLTDWT